MEKAEWENSLEIKRNQKQAGLKIYRPPFWCLQPKAGYFIKTTVTIIVCHSSMHTKTCFPEIIIPSWPYFCEKIASKWRYDVAGRLINPFFPANHMCDSQVCCGSIFYFLFADKPAAAGATLLRPFFLPSTLQTMLPVKYGLYCLAFEWIGRENYLGFPLNKNINSNSV